MFAGAVRAQEQESVPVEPYCYITSRYDNNFLYLILVYASGCLLATFQPAQKCAFSHFPSLGWLLQLPLSRKSKCSRWWILLVSQSAAESQGWKSPTPHYGHHFNQNNKPDWRIYYLCLGPFPISFPHSQVRSSLALFTAGQKKYKKVLASSEGNFYIF